MNIEAYAEKLGIELYEEYLATDAAKLCRVGVGALRRAKEMGELNYLQAGEKRYKFLGLDLVQWKIQKRNIVSGNITSLKTGPASGVEPGTNQRPSKDAVTALARETFKKQKRS